ncbi:MAG TPA: pyrimidine dimer DNA glycosylase/endonuclease V [Bacilli bacterium]|nr:pyrimidine dimer DNA glycosylase/endonuclease V [Bacilli bacterium]
MRLWHDKLIPNLPNLQLLSQWRELNSIYVKQNAHILINYCYDYPLDHLFSYSKLVIEEMGKRGFNIRSFVNHDNFFQNKVYGIIDHLFPEHHNQEYLEICCYNLYEKLIRGQNFKGANIDYIKRIINKD